MLRDLERLGIGNPRLLRSPYHINFLHIAGVANRLFVTPIFVPCDCDIDEINCLVITTSAGKSFRIGLYAGVPGSESPANTPLLLDSGNISAGVTGPIRASIPAGLRLNRGLNWLGLATEDNVMTYGVSSRLSFFDGGAYPTLDGVYYDMVGWGAPPNPFPAAGFTVDAAGTRVSYVMHVLRWLDKQQEDLGFPARLSHLGKRTYGNFGLGQHQFGFTYNDLDGVANRVFLAPFWAPKSVAVDEINWRVATASAGKSFRVGIYQGRPQLDTPEGAILLYDSGNVNATPVGGLRVLPPDIRIERGQAWFAIATEDAVMKTTTMSTMDQRMFFGGVAPMLDGCHYDLVGWGALTNPCPAVTHNVFGKWNFWAHLKDWLSP